MIVPGSAYKSVVMQNAAVATGAGTAIEVTDVDGGAFLSLTLQVVGITTATVTFQGTIDGTNWTSIEFSSLADSTALATTATADGIYRATVLGLWKVRANITSWTTGTITITGYLCA